MFSGSKIVTSFCLISSKDCKVHHSNIMTYLRVASCESTVITLASDSSLSLCVQMSLSISLECHGNDSCMGSALYCPISANCTLYCEQNASSPCDAANIYISESLLDISCESGDCILYENWCSDHSFSSCSTNSFIAMIPLNCTTVEHCQVE